MNKNEKTLTALLAVAIIILLLLYFNSKRVAAVASNTPLQMPPEIQPANYSVWQGNIPSINFDFGNWRPTIGEIYYASGSCMCQG
jgi:apolipoprotein N-acyltransferase